MTLQVAVHEGVTCAGCRTTPLEGTRRRCLLCLDVDLCPRCCEAHAHDCFLVLPTPCAPEWLETLRLLSCVSAMSGADEFKGIDGLRAPPPQGVNDRLRTFITHGATAICPPGEALMPKSNPAGYLEGIAQQRQRKTLLEDRVRQRPFLSSFAPALHPSLIIHFIQPASHA